MNNDDIVKRFQIDTDPEMNRHYIPVHPDWEIQTKGKGSSFRIYRRIDGQRWVVLDEHLHFALEQMARSVNDLIEEQAREIERLNTCIKWEQNRAERIGTHGVGCWKWGHQHYECALRELAAAQEEIEGLKRGAQTLDDVWQKQLAAAQAQIVKYREALELCVPVMEHYAGTTRHAEFKAALAQPTDQSALDEAIRQAKIEVLRDALSEYCSWSHLRDMIAELEK